MQEWHVCWSLSPSVMIYILALLGAEQRRIGLENVADRKNNLGGRDTLL